jgi:Mn-dependent transcriptional regulator
MYESGENYLETILVLGQRNGNVRSIDIAREMEFSKPSVSRAMGLLKESGYIVIDKAGLIKLTDLGKEKAYQIYERHKFLTRFLQQITGLSEAVAEADACRMEHIISEEVYDGIKRFMNECEKFKENECEKLSK